MQPGWCQPVRQEFTEKECEALPGVAYPGVRDNRSTLNTKTGYDNDDLQKFSLFLLFWYIYFYFISPSINKCSSTKKFRVHDKKTVVFVQLNVSVHFIIPVK